MATPLLTSSDSSEGPSRESLISAIKDIQSPAGDKNAKISALKSRYPKEALIKALVELKGQNMNGTIKLVLQRLGVKNPNKLLK
jgi:hypothetical protein